MGLNVGLNARPAAGFAYVPGQKIDGDVRYTAEKNGEKIETVSVVYQCKVHTQITRSNGKNRNTYREKIYLFRYKATLFRGAQELAQGTSIQWPFEFMTPLTSDYNRKDNGDPRFAPAGPCPLPPSFVFDTNGFSTSGFVAIKYKLKFVINEQNMIRGKRKCSVPLKFVNVSPTPLPPPQVVGINGGMTEWQSRKLRPESHTFKQKMQHVFTSNPELRTPSVAFKTFLHMPQAMALDQTAPVSISLLRETMGPTDPEEISLVLVRLNLTFKGKTTIRVEGSLFSRNYVDDGDGPSATVPHVFDPPKLLPHDGTLVTVNSNLRLPLILGGNSTFTPHFKTYTVGHWHALKAEAVIRHVQSGHVFNVKVKSDFHVLPSCVTPQPSPGVPSSPQPAGQFANNRYAVHELPPYHDTYDLPAYQDPPEMSAENKQSEMLADSRTA